MYEEKAIKYKKIKRKKKHQNTYLFTDKHSKLKNPKKNIKKKKKITNSFLNSINWKSLIWKLSMLVLVMLLIIFILSRIDNYVKRKDAVINNNLNQILDATLAYYNNNNLPKNIGDSSSLLIDEMIKNNILKSIEDKDGISCNPIESYIIMTKEETNLYRLKISLTCQNEKKTKEEKIICKEKCYVKTTS